MLAVVFIVALGSLALAVGILVLRFLGKPAAPSGD